MYKKYIQKKNMKNILKISIVLLIVIMMSWVTTSNKSYAETTGSTSFKATLTSESNEGQLGSTISVMFGVSNLSTQMSSEGVDTLQAVLTYDKNVFEEIPTSDELDSNDDLLIKDYFEAQNNWDNVPTYNKTNGVMVATKSGTLKTTANIYKINFKIKSNATLGDTVIKISDVKMAKDTDFTGEDASLTIKIVEKVTQPESSDSSNTGKENNNESDSKTNTDTKTTTNTGTTSTESKKSTNTGTTSTGNKTTTNTSNVKTVYSSSGAETTSSKSSTSTGTSSSLPYTGNTTYKILIFAVAFVVIAIISYVYVRKYRGI